MNSEESRLRTFQCWPSNAIVDPRKIAKAGFFYVGRGIEVQCFKCGGKISEWNYGDSAMGRHRVLDSRCPFVVDPEGSGNVPLGGPPPILRVPPLNHRREEAAPVDYTSEEVRLESFSFWPQPSPINPQILAQSGFYYTRIGDKVRCAYCNGEVDSWTGKEIPDEVHKERFPQCTYMVDRLFVNDDLGVSKVDGSSSSMKELGINTHKVPANPKYSTYESRLKTFSTWPASLCQKPEEMAKAGFYFTGKDDQVRCFHCDGGLRLWEKDDIPWREHARWFSDCEYVVLVMGQEFINETLSSGAKSFMLAASNDLADMLGHSNCINGGAKVTPQKKIQRLHSITEDELQRLMCSPEAMAALQVGIEHSRVKMALKKKVQLTGTPFPTADVLISAALDMQNEESASQEDETWGTPPNSPHFGWQRRVCRSRNYNPSPIESSTDDDDEQEAYSAVTTSDNNVNKSNPIQESEEPQSEKVPLSLEEENRRLKEARLCKICMDSEVGVVFLPCGHLVTCANCAHSLIDCPLCRQVIKATVRTFLS